MAWWNPFSLFGRRKRKEKELLQSLLADLRAEQVITLQLESTLQDFIRRYDMLRPEEKAAGWSRIHNEFLAMTQRERAAEMLEKLYRKTRSRHLKEMIKKMKS